MPVLEQIHEAISCTFCKNFHNKNVKDWLPTGILWVIIEPWVYQAWHLRDVLLGWIHQVLVKGGFFTRGKKSANLALELILCTSVPLSSIARSLHRTARYIEMPFPLNRLVQVCLELTKTSPIMRKEESFLPPPEEALLSVRVFSVSWLFLPSSFHNRSEDTPHILQLHTTFVEADHFLSWEEWNAWVLWRSYGWQTTSGSTRRFSVKRNLTFRISVPQVERSYCLSFGCVCFINSSINCVVLWPSGTTNYL